MPRGPQMRTLVRNRKHQQDWTDECGLTQQSQPFGHHHINKALTEIIGPLALCFSLVSWSPLVTFCCHQRSQFCGSTATFNCSADYSHSMSCVKQPLSKQELPGHHPSHPLLLSEACRGCVLPHFMQVQAQLKHTELLSLHSTSRIKLKLQGQQFICPE